MGRRRDDCLEWIDWILIIVVLDEAVAEDIRAFGDGASYMDVVVLFLEYLPMAGCSLGSFGDGWRICSCGDIGQYR